MFTNTVKANKICAGLKKLRDAGKTQEEIVQVLQDLELPIDLHLHIMGHFDHVTTEGRLYSKKDEKLRKLIQ